MAKGRDDQTSTRLFSDDNRDLKQLGAMLGISAAEAFERLCRPVVRSALRAELKRKQAELDKDKS